MTQQARVLAPLTEHQRSSLPGIHITHLATTPYSSSSKDSLFQTVWEQALMCTYNTNTCTHKHKLKPKNKTKTENSNCSYHFK